MKMFDIKFICINVQKKLKHKKKLQLHLYSISDLKSLKCKWKKCLQYQLQSNVKSLPNEKLSKDISVSPAEYL